jgi:hypothetical protein
MTPAFRPRRPAWAVTGALVLAAYALGVLTYRNQWPPLGLWHRLRSVPVEYQYFADLKGKTVVDCPARDPRTAVIVALGQSNGSNMPSLGEPHVHGVPGAVNFFDGRCYAADDPILGSDGDGNSPWTLVANDLIATRAADRVVIAALTISNTSVADWTTNSFFARRLDRISADLAAANLQPTAIAWFQGEADNMRQTDAGEYVRAFALLEQSLRRRGWSAPIYLSMTTICQTPPNDTLRAAQRRIAAGAGVRPGPDTDALGFAARWDGCHFTPAGRREVASLWAEALRRP